MASLFDIATVTIPQKEYEKLVRENEQIGIIKRLLAKSEYISTGDLRVILNVEKENENNENNENNGN